MKKIYSFVLTSFLCVAGINTQAQTQIHPITGATIPNPYPTTIQEIQTVSAANLASCNDVSPFVNLTVIVRGRMLFSGRTIFPAFTASGVSYPSTILSTAVNQYGRDLFMQAGTGPFAGLSIRNGTCGVNGGTDMLAAIAGDSVEVMGIVEDNSAVGTGGTFGGNTQINPKSFTRLTALPTSNKPPQKDGTQVEGFAPILITDLAKLNINASTTETLINNLVDGEQYENMFVELRDLTVVSYTNGGQTLTDPDYNSSTQRVRILCTDGTNFIQVYDRFKAGRLPLNNHTSGTCGGTVSLGGAFAKVPRVGGKFNSVKGILVNVKSQVPGQTCANVPAGSNDRGYQIHPFYPSHYDIADYNQPIISNVKLSPMAPKPLEDMTITIDAVSIDQGYSIATAGIYYAFDTLKLLSPVATDKFYLPMTNIGGSTFQGRIPGLSFAEGMLVYFYIKVSDTRTPSLDKYFPEIPSTIGGIKFGNAKPAFFVVRNNNALQIKDVQYTPFSDGNSGYVGRVVTLTGVATSNTKDLGRVTIQQEGASEWGGIFLESNPFLQNIKKGDKITVSGTIKEEFSGSSFGRAANFTSLTALSATSNIIPSASGIKISPLLIDHLTLAGNYDFKKHEKYEAMLATIYNSSGGKLFVLDTNADFTANFSEYRIGTDTAAANAVMQTTTVSSFRNVSIAGTRVLAGRTPSNGSPAVINSQVFPLVNNPYSMVVSTAVSPTSPDVATIKSNKINPVYVSRKMSFISMSGIIQHSFGNMKLLPRDIFDINGLLVNGVAPVLTLDGFTTAIHATDPELKLAIFPNPTDGVVTIHNASDNVYNISILNLTGAEVANYTLNQSLVFDMSSRPKGLYLIKIADTNNRTIGTYKLSVN